MRPVTSSHKGVFDAKNSLIDLSDSCKKPKQAKFDLDNAFYLI